MDIFDKLMLASTDEVQLSVFIKENNQRLYDFLLTQSFTELSKSKSKIENYISTNLRTIRHLDFSAESTVIFTTFCVFSFCLGAMRSETTLSMVLKEMV